LDNSFVGPGDFYPNLVEIGRRAKFFCSSRQPSRPLRMRDENSKLNSCSTLLAQPREKNRRMLRGNRPSNRRRADEIRQRKSPLHRRTRVILGRAIGLPPAILRQGEAPKDFTSWTAWPRYAPSLFPNLAIRISKSETISNEKY
jgi:hypothetical protein